MEIGNYKNGPTTQCKIHGCRLLGAFREPDSTSEVHEIIHKDTIVFPLVEDGKYTQVSLQLKGDPIGWIKTEFLKDV